MAKRHNIDTIAEVLIDKLGDMEKTASRIEKVAQTPLKVELNELKSILQQVAGYVTEQKEASNVILSNFKQLQEKNQGRLPNWVVGVLFAFFLTFVGFSLYIWKTAETYDDQKAKAEYFEREFYKLKNPEK